MNRTIQLRGEDISIVRYLQDGTDNHGDNIWTKEFEETKGIVEINRAPRSSTDSTGTRFDSDVIVYVSDDIEVHEAANSEKPSRIDRHMTGNSFRVQMAFNEGNGIIKCECERIT